MNNDVLKPIKKWGRLVNSLTLGLEGLKNMLFCKKRNALTVTDFWVVARITATVCVFR